MKKLVLAAAALAVAAPVFPAAADPPPWAPAHGRRAKERAAAQERDWRQYRRYDWNRVENGSRRYYADRYYRSGQYYADRRLAYGDRVYRGYNGQYYCRRDDGTTGLIVGGAIGALLGNQLAPGDSQTIGTIIGAGAGALLGREIDRGGVRCD